MRIPFPTTAVDSAPNAHDKITQYIVANGIRYTSLLFCRG